MLFAKNQTFWPPQKMFSPQIFGLAAPLSVPQKICEIRCGAKGWDESQWGFFLWRWEWTIVTYNLSHRMSDAVLRLREDSLLFACEQRL